MNELNFSQISILILYKAPPITVERKCPIWNWSNEPITNPIFFPSARAVFNASMSNWPTGDNGIPSNWTVQDYQG